MCCPRGNWKAGVLNSFGKWDHEGQWDQLKGPGTLLSERCWASILLCSPLKPKPMAWVHPGRGHRAPGAGQLQRLLGCMN